MWKLKLSRLTQSEVFKWLSSKDGSTYKYEADLSLSAVFLIFGSCLLISKVVLTVRIINKQHIIYVKISKLEPGCKIRSSCRVQWLDELCVIWTYKYVRKRWDAIGHLHASRRPCTHLNTWILHIFYWLTPVLFLKLSWLSEFWNSNIPWYLYFTSYKRPPYNSDDISC